MPRPLALGNGRLLVQIDSKGRIRDFFWPLVGIRNHVGGHYFHTGIFEAGRFSWLEWDEWDIRQDFDPKSGERATIHSSSAMQLEVACFDRLEGDCFIRRVVLTNRSAWDREIEIFFSQDFRIAESEVGDTAFYHPGLDAMVHFKWSYCFACSGRSEEGGLRQKTVGIRGVQGLQGTWRDAEDGMLQEKPIEQGAVDSTFSLAVALPASGTASAEYRITCFDRVPVAATPPIEPRLCSERRSLVNADLFQSLPAPVMRLVDQSIPILLSQIADNGAILAANDSDIMRANKANYSYVWPRDGALVAVVLDRLGLHQVSRDYHRFALSLISEAQPFFLQKYCADGTFGATWHPWIFDGKPEIPLQEDETALSLWSLTKHIETSGDDSLLDQFYDSAVVPMARFLCNHLSPETGLPIASYDLWEERRGIHAFTVSTVVAGLNAAADLAGRRKDAEGPRFRAVAASVKDALLKYLFNVQDQRFIRTAEAVGSQVMLDHTPDASLLLVRRFAGLDSQDVRCRATLDHIVRSLWVHSPIAGLARYSGDYYARVSEDHPGNPWLITTMWLAQEQIGAAVNVGDLDAPLKLLEWAVERAESTGVLGEQFDPNTGETLTVSPLTWSHAEYLSTCLDWAEKYRSLAES